MKPVPFLLLVIPLLGAAPRVPTVEDLLSLKSAGRALISPDGKWIAYSVSEADFKKDAYLARLWMIDTATGRNFQLTGGDKPATGAQWSPDGAWLTFVSDRAGDKNQIFLISPEGGDRKSTRLNSSHSRASRMPSSA